MKDRKDKKEKRIHFVFDKKTKNVLSLVCNALFVILAVYCFIIIIVKGGQGNMEVEGKEGLRYFTIESNLLCALSCLIVLIYNIRGIGIPKWALKLKYVGCVSVGVTMVVALAFLGPMVGFDQILGGINLFLHLIMPLLAIFSFILFEGEIQYKNRFGERSKNRPISLKESLLGIIPTLIYGLLYYYLVLIAGKWEDFYSFNSGMLEGKWYLVYIAIVLLALLLGVIIRGFHILCNKEYKIRGYTL